MPYIIVIDNNSIFSFICILFQCSIRHQNENQFNAENKVYSVFCLHLLFKFVSSSRLFGIVCWILFSAYVSREFVIEYMINSIEILRNCDISTQNHLEKKNITKHIYASKWLIIFSFVSVICFYFLTFVFDLFCH